MYINKRVPLSKCQPTHANLPHLKCAYNDEVSRVPQILAYNRMHHFGVKKKNSGFRPGAPILVPISNHVTSGKLFKLCEAPFLHQSSGEHHSGATE